MLAYTEARAALARARRTGRLDASGLVAAASDFELVYRQMHLIGIDQPLARRAGEMAESWSLRAYDAVHLAAAERLADDDSVLVSADRALCAAAREAGLRVSEL